MFQIISLDFRSFRYGTVSTCDGDKIQIISGPETQEFCGLSIPQVNPLSNTVSIKSFDDSMDPQNGFSINWRAVDPREY